MLLDVIEHSSIIFKAATRTLPPLSTDCDFWSTVSPPKTCSMKLAAASLNA